MNLIMSAQSLPWRPPDHNNQPIHKHVVWLACMVSPYWYLLALLGVTIDIHSHIHVICTGSANTLVLLC